MQRNVTLSQIMSSNFIRSLANKYLLVIRTHSRGRGRHVTNNPLKTFLISCLWNFTLQNLIQGFACKWVCCPWCWPGRLRLIIIFLHIIQSGNWMVLLSALSLTWLMSETGLLTALTICKAFSILPDTKSSINGSISYCYYYAIILQAPIYSLPLPRYIPPSKTQFG